MKYSLSNISEGVVKVTKDIRRLCDGTPLSDCALDFEARALNLNDTANTKRMLYHDNCCIKCKKEDEIGEHVELELGCAHGSLC